jgi:signal transduction histidine kinase
VAGGPTERLLRRTQRRLFAVTLALLVLLVVGVGAATLLIGTSALDADVDRALETAVQGQLATLEGSLPSTEEEQETSEHAPAVAETVLLLLDSTGRVVSSPGGTTIAGMPDAAAVRAAAGGSDLRTIESGSTEVRLLTVPVIADGKTMGYVQGGFVLALHDQQSRSLVLAVLVVGGLGLIAAAIITLMVTSRALVPIREGFEAQRRFVADASHELRTPAALIRANAEVLQREDLVAEGGRELIEDVIGEADRLGGLVGDLLQLSAWDDTSLVLEVAPLDVAGIARDTVRGATALAAERGVHLAADTPVPVPADADRARIVQLLLILVDNAIDHSPPGGEVSVAVGAVDGSAVITVDDGGPGIAASDRERIFEAFTRLPGSTRHGSGGTGLGLAIARRIVDAHAGTIEAGSAPSGGARFTVTLPGGGA